MDYRIGKLKDINRTGKLVFISLLVAQALVLSFVERMIPINFGIPGVKLGLANIIVLFAIYLLSFKETLALVVVRCFLFAFIAGSFSGLLYSLSGGVLSFLVMYLLTHLDESKISVIGISIVGAVFHNLGQLLMAALIVQNIRLTLYLPIMSMAGIGTGICVGATVLLLLKCYRRIPYFLRTIRDLT